MVQLSLFLLFVLFLKGHGALDVKIKPYNTVSYGTTVTAECSDNINAPVNNAKWSLDPDVTDKKSVDNKLTIPQISANTKITCTKPDDSQTGVATVKVINVAGVSSSDCRSGCEVSCLMEPLDKKPTKITWSSSNKHITNLEEGKSEEHDHNNPNLDNTIYTHRSDEFSYNSQQTYLKIGNLTKTTYLTCTFTLEDTSVISYTVSAIIRPTNKCHVNRQCVTRDKCHSNAVEDATCKADCQECFTYRYRIGDFIENKSAGMTCYNDKEWCVAYLKERKLCSEIERDPIANYCSECGNCLPEFSPTKLVLPLVILTCLCLLTVLMCYKSYEEKRSVLPKVHVSQNEQGGQIKSSNGGGACKRGGDSGCGQIIIPNDLTESNFSNEALVANSANVAEEPGVVVERGILVEGGGGSARLQNSASQEQNLNFGSEDDLRRASNEGASKGLSSEEARKLSIEGVRKVSSSEGTRGTAREKSGTSEISTRDVQVHSISDT